LDDFAISFYLGTVIGLSGLGPCFAADLFASDVVSALCSENCAGG